MSAEWLRERFNLEEKIELYNDSELAEIAKRLPVPPLSQNFFDEDSVRHPRERNMDEIINGEEIKELH